MVNVTGTVKLPFEVEVNAICPEYVPTANETVGFTVTVITSGVVQQLAPDLEMVSHEPPVVVVAVAVKVKFVLVLTTVSTWGSGLVPANGLVKDTEGTCAKVCACEEPHSERANITMRSGRRKVLPFCGVWLIILRSIPELL